MGPKKGPSGSCRPQMGPMLAPWTLLSGIRVSFVNDIKLVLFPSSHNHSLRRTPSMINMYAGGILWKLKKKQYYFFHMIRNTSHDILRCHIHDMKASGRARNQSIYACRKDIRIISALIQTYCPEQKYIYKITSICSRLCIALFCISCVKDFREIFVTDTLQGYFIGTRKTVVGNFAKGRGRKTQQMIKGLHLGRIILYIYKHIYDYIHMYTYAGKPHQYWTNKNYIK